MKDCNIQLREWAKKKFGDEKGYIRKAAEYTGIHYVTLKAYMGGRYFPGEENRKTLFMKTGLECYATEEVKDEISESMMKELESVGREIHEKYPTPLGRTLYIRQLVSTIMDELDYFKDSSPEERGMLAENVDPKDIGYLASLIKALFDEDKFQQFMLLTTYKRKR